MFFAPTIAAFLSASIPVHLLCLSTGNYDGLGAQRSLELSAAARVLRLSSSTVVDDARLLDGPSNHWPAAAIADRISEAASRVNATHILTFDAGGVSAHPNHVSTHRGCVAFVRARAGMQLLTLTTSPLLVKYLGVFALLLHSQLSQHLQSRQACISNASPHLVIRAMRAHGSQLTWFRYLFIFFSHYTYFNHVALETA
jgi:N-acetylglucosaminylphosphatidylinositol deacetylase